MTNELISIRQSTRGDASSLQALLLQLGYSLDLPEVQRRYDAVAVSEDHSLIVAEKAGQVTAFCHVYIRPALDKPPEAVVQALVIDQAARGSGIGKTMMAAAETWARDRGFMSVALASSVARPEAHTFYEGIGYRRVATSHLFRKGLD